MATPLGKIKIGCQPTDDTDSVDKPKRPIARLAWMEVPIFKRGLGDYNQHNKKGWYQNGVAITGQGTDRLMIAGLAIEYDINRVLHPTT